MDTPLRQRASSRDVLDMVVQSGLLVMLVAVSTIPLLRAANTNVYRDVASALITDEERDKCFCCVDGTKRCCLPYDPTQTYPDNTTCELCCLQLCSGSPPPIHCYPTAESAFYLVAQIALGTALVVAIAALISIIFRSYSGRSGRQQRPQFRPPDPTSSISSVDMYVAQRMHDCPPSYDDISWEKPPSYGDLQILQENNGGASACPERACPQVMASRERASDAPPQYSGVFIISPQEQYQQPQADDIDQGIVFVAASTEETPSEELQYRTSAPDAPQYSGMFFISPQVQCLQSQVTADDIDQGIVVTTEETASEELEYRTSAPDAMHSIKIPEGD